MNIFSPSEIERRWKRLRSKMETCDAAIFCSFTNSYYMSGAPILPWGRPGITLVPKDDDPVIIAGKADDQNIRSNSPIRKIITYGDIEGPNLQAALAKLSDQLHEQGLKRVGFDGLYTPHAWIERLKVQNPGTEFFDFSDVIEELRLINSDEEVELIRKATAIADFGMQTFLDKAKLGMTEIELAGRVSLAMARFASETIQGHDVNLNCYSQQGNSTDVHAASGPKPLMPGQLMCVVVEASVSHYMAAVERAVGLGELLPEQEHYYQTLIKALQHTVQACAPGAPCSDIDATSQGIFKQAGYENFLCGTGLSRGLINAFEGRLDHSNLRVYNTRPLAPNMVLSVEPYAIAPGVGAQRHCEMVLITDTGHEVLSKAPNGMLSIFG